MSMDILTETERETALSSASGSCIYLEKNSVKELFFWNCAAGAARINRKAFYSAAIIIYP